MSCFCDCFPNISSSSLSISTSRILDELDRWGFTIIHSLWPGQPSEWGWVSVWKQRSIVLFVCVVLYHFFQPALLISFVCCCSSLLLQDLTQKIANWPAKYSICLHHFICSIEPSLLNLPFLVVFSFYSHRSPQLATAHHAPQPTSLWNEANFPSGFDVKLRNVRNDDKSS